MERVIFEHFVMNYLILNLSFLFLLYEVTPKNSEITQEGN